MAGDPSPTPRGVLTSGPDGFGATPTWQLTATACDDSFPAAQLVLQACTAVCSRKYLVSQVVVNTGSTSARLRWEGCTTPFPRHGGDGSSNATLDIDITVTVTGAVSEWGATVGKKNAQGVRTFPCLILSHCFGTHGCCTRDNFTSFILDRSEFSHK